MRKVGQGLSVFMTWVLSLVVLVQSQTPSNQTKPLRVASPSTKAANLITSPEAVGLSSERLERITNTMQRDIDSGRIAGAVTLVARHGKIAYFRAFGMADK